MNAHNAADAVHDKVFKLLPWRINGTLSSTDCALVDSHIENCPSCKHEFSLLQTTFQAALAVPVAVPDVQRSLARSLQRIQSEPQSNIHPTPSLTDHLRNLIDWLQRQFDRLTSNRMTVVATGFALFFVAFFALQQRPPVPNDDYRVLSSPIAAAESTRLSIDFKTDLSPVEAESVLQDAVPGLLTSAELQHSNGKQYILSLPASTSIKQISILVRDLGNLPAISQVEMQAPD